MPVGSDRVWIWTVPTAPIAARSTAIQDCFIVGRNAAKWNTIDTMNSEIRDICPYAAKMIQIIDECSSAGRCYYQVLNDARWIMNGMTFAVRKRIFAASWELIRERIVKRRGHRKPNWITILRFTVNQSAQNCAVAGTRGDGAVDSGCYRVPDRIADGNFAPFSYCAIKLYVWSYLQ